MKIFHLKRLIQLFAVGIGVVALAQQGPLSRPPQAAAPTGPLSRPPQAGGPQSPPPVPASPPRPAAPQRPPEPAPPHPPAHVIIPEELPNSMISVGRMRRLPANFTDVENLSWNADGSKLLVERLRRRTYEIAIIDVPEHFSDTKPLPERVINDSQREVMSLHTGSPCWLSGSQSEQFLFTRQSPSSRDFMASIPSNGWHCNLYLGGAGRSAIPLTQYLYSSTVPLGVAAPRISADGKTLFWCGVNGRAKDKNIWGRRGLYVAGLEWNRGIPRMVNVRELADSRLGTFKESCDISQDGTCLIYCANKSTVPWFVTDLYVRNLKGNTIKCVAEGGMNRWASYSPKGKKILWSSSRGFTIPNMGAAGLRWQQELRTELWLMTADGLDKRRLTHFNQRDSRDNRFLGMTAQDHCYVGASAWHPNGRQIAVVIVFGARKKATSLVLLLDLTDRG